MALELIKSEAGIELVKDSGNWILKKDLGFSPVQTMVATVGACGAYVYQSILERSRIEHNFVKATIDYQTNEATSVHFVTGIVIHYYLEVSPDAQSRALTAAKLIPNHCPVMQSLNPDIKIEEEVHFI